MKTFLKQFTYFVIWSLLVYFAILLLIGTMKIQFKGLNFSNLKPGRLLLRVEDSRKIEKLQILFLGSSRSFMGFDTRIFNQNGLTSFNFGSIAQTPVQTEYLYKKYAQRIKTDTIVYEVNPMIFDNDGIESTLDFITSIDIDNVLFKLAVSTHHPSVINTIVYMYFKKAVGKKPVYTDDRKGYVEGGGYVESRDKNQSASQKFDKSPIQYNDKQIRAFESLLSLFSKNNQKFILVQTPVTKNYYNSLDGIEEFDKRMSSYGTYYNFNRLMELNDTSDFVDNLHMNQQGVEKFNNEFLKIVFHKYAK